MHLCQKQVSLFLVSLFIISQQLHNLLNKFMATSGAMFCLNIQMHMTDSGGGSKLFLLEIAQHYVIN